MTWPELVITADLSDALEWVLGAAPSTPEPVVVVAACLDVLAKGFGLSESGHLDWDPLDHAELPAPALALIHHLFAEDAPKLTADTLRDGLHRLLVLLAQDREARKKVNRNDPLTEVELLTAGQIHWNLEARGARSTLPLQGGPITVKSGSASKQREADIRVPNANKDFATMTWTARVNQKGPYKSSGQGFRNQGARLTVLAAQLVVSTAPGPLPDLQGAVLQHTQADPSSSRVSSITWPELEPTATDLTTSPQVHAADVGTPKPAIPDRVRADEHADFGSQRVLVGAPAQVGVDYQVRGFDTEIEQLWANGGDRRIWLRGGPGLGKSYAARRVIQQALSDQAPDRDELLIWVDSADPESVTTAFAEAMDQLSHLGVRAGTPTTSPDGQKARTLLRLLTTSTWRWLIVLDNAEAGSLIDAGLVPNGANPNGRILFTTRSRDPRIASHGRAVRAGLFTPEEAESYLRSEAHSADQDPAPLSKASQEDTGALAAAVGRHPLGLSVAASTIVANAMTVRDWIEEFTATAGMDVAADEPDRGGYPHQIGATWTVALRRASQGLPEGVVERAAMVAAIQDPDGHPTWLWDRPTVANWVAGGTTLTRHHAKPVAVQRLIDHGIVELRGQTWKHGRITLHQLAARAIRESADPAPLGELAGILTQEWLLAITANHDTVRPGVLHRSLRAISALPDLPTATRTMATALLAYKQPWRFSAHFIRERVEALGPYLAAGGATIRIELADQLLELADEEASLGRIDQADTEYRKAADLYRQLVDDASLTDSEAVSCLIRLGDLETNVGDPDLAQVYRQRAALLLERLVDTESDNDRLCRRLADLVTLYDHLGDAERKARALTHAEELLTQHPDDSPPDADWWAVRKAGGTWQTLAGLMEQAGNLDAAKDCLARAAATYERSPEDTWAGNPWTEAMQGLALLHAKTGDWADAEHYLTRITDPTQTPWPDRDEVRQDTLVLLASVQTHLGRNDDADQNLTLAADEYVEPTNLEELPFYLLDKLPEERLEWPLQDLASMAIAADRAEDARALRGALLDLAQKGADGAPGDREAEAKLATAYFDRGLVEFLDDNERGAIPFLDHAITIRQALADLDSSDAVALRNISKALDLLGHCLTDPGQDRARHVARTKAVNAHRRTVELLPDDRRAAIELAAALKQLARDQMDLGDQESAVACQVESVEILSRLAASAPQDHPTQIAHGVALMSLGRIWILRGQPEEALPPLRRAVDVLAPLEQVDNRTRRQLAESQLLLSLALDQAQLPQELEPHLAAAIGTYRALAESDPADHEIQSQLAMSLMLLGEEQARSGQQEQGADHLTRAVNILQLLADLNPGERPFLLIGALDGLAVLLRDLGRTDEADQAIARATVLEDRYRDDDG